MAKPVRIDLEDLIQAMESGFDELGFFLDPESGEIHSLEEGPTDPETDDLKEGCLRVPRHESRFEYGLMERFAESVKDGRARDELLRALEGKGAFRRFKDRLRDYPELRERWFQEKHAAYAQAAEEWLRAQGLEFEFEKRVAAPFSKPAR